MENNKGLEIEQKMKKWFKGKRHRLECVDFQTSTTLYEVKSCQLIVKCHHKKKRKNIFNEHQIGRFRIVRRNHEDIYLEGIERKKLVKYVFVITIGNQIVWRTMSWKEVDQLIKENKHETRIRINDVFKVI